ncbi:neutral zinc metallopeptidase [Sphingomonas sp. ID0503]|uniref:KPN_02809 family neutral zinc metallopeptidase n=1 Tax=Sphingomonas sp. ID0503 TaxID=3399691 RepID=UPI003AFA57E6
MRLDDQRESSNFEIGGRGGGGGFGGGLPLGLLFANPKLGCLVIVVMIVGALVMGINPLSLIGGGGAPVQTQGSRDVSQLTPVQRWSLKVLGSTEDTWGKIFAESGQRYQPSTLRFYTRSDVSGCGAAQSAMGPFYCPTDQKVYLDTSFFDELSQRFGAPGDFAQAYVIAHEIGHHIQDLTGTLDKARQLQSRASSAEGNAVQVKVELQADCYAGVWGARNRQLLEPGDIEEGMRAANSIGDDTLQKEAGQRPMPDSFTHGTSAQRMEWLKKGLDSGDPAVCDTGI